MALSGHIDMQLPQKRTLEFGSENLLNMAYKALKGSLRF